MGWRQSTTDVEPSEKVSGCFILSVTTDQHQLQKSILQIETIFTIVKQQQSKNQRSFREGVLSSFEPY